MTVAQSVPKVKKFSPECSVIIRATIAGTNYHASLKASKDHTHEAPLFRMKYKATRLVSGGCGILSC